MATAISNKNLLEKCKRYILQDASSTANDDLIKDALITANREISDLGGSEPLAWLKENYQGIFTRYYASISAMTSADPCVITAESVDPDLTDDTGFQTGDIVYLDGVNGENSLHKLNNRLYRAVRASATTITLKTLDGQTAIDSSDFPDYDTGGTIYHAGIVLPKTSIEPQAGDAQSLWKIDHVYEVMVDGYPCYPITQDDAVNQRLNRPGSRPQRWRYQKYSYGSFSSTDNLEHILLWYPYAGQRYHIESMIKKSYPDLATFSSTVYPPQPIEIHDCIWHRALALLATHAERQRRKSSGKDGMMGDNTKIEILNANYWISKMNDDEINILEYSRKLNGELAHLGEGISA